VLEVCFNREGIWFHAYIGQRADFPTLAAIPAFLDRDGMSVAAWADEAQSISWRARRAARLERLL